MTPKKNTPTPWTQINGSSMVIEAQDGTWIAKTFEDNPNNYADTAFIVQCVNEREALKASHKELRERLQIIANTVREDKDWSQYSSDMLLSVIHSMAEEASAALEAVEHDLRNGE